MNCILYHPAGESDLAAGLIRAVRDAGHKIGARNADIFLRNPQLEREYERIFVSESCAQVAEAYDGEARSIDEAGKEHGFDVFIVALGDDAPALVLANLGPAPQPLATTAAPHDGPEAEATPKPQTPQPIQPPNRDLPPVSEGELKQWRFFKVKTEVKARTGHVPANKDDARALLKAVGLWTE